MAAVTLTVTSAATGVACETVTNTEGLYNVPALNARPYNIRAELAGFSPQVRNGVHDGATLTVDLQLALAQVQQSGTVLS